MTPERWRQIQKIFHDLLPLAAAERTAALRQACGDDLELEQQVRSMLEADAAAQAEDAAEQVVADLAEHLDQPRPESVQQFGPYRVLRQIGRGGMGTVFLAERADGQFRQQVAIKLVRPGLDDEQIQQRFRQERQILAALEHPCIARLIDGGVTEDGRPYFVMEHVRGEPLDVYCDRRRLSVRARIELFLEVCAAVHHAHQNLVLHRDLKPANLLVTSDGAPKLLDFGIAKLLDTESPFTRAETVPGLRLLTPEFASPEQIRGEVLSTASDVYSLGVLLYLLLTGRQPYRLPRRSLELEKAVSETHPVRPSVAVAQTDDWLAIDAEAAEVSTTESADAESVRQARTIRQTPERVARLRSERPERLRRLLAGDLDTILLTALRKEPERRYASVEQLAEDLRRHLGTLPIRARPESTSYRIAKFVRRHHLLVTAASLIVVSLVFGIVATTWQARRADRALGQAQISTQRAEQALELLLEIFGQADPGTAVRPDVTVRQVLDRAREVVATSLMVQPLDRAVLLETMGRAYLGLGHPAEAEPLLEVALELHRSELSADDPRIAESLAHLADLRYSQGRYTDAEKLQLEALVLRREAFGERCLPVARSLGELAALAEVQGREEEARTRYERALSIFRETVGEEHADYARTLGNLGVLEYWQANYAVAEVQLRQAVAIGNRVLPSTHPTIALNVASLAVAIEMQGRGDEAEELMRRALATQLEVLGPDHPQVASTRHNLATLLSNRKEYESAEVLYRDSLDSHRQRLGDQHPALALVLINLADLLMRQKELDAAGDFYRQALEIRRQKGVPAADLAIALARLANAIASTKPAEAEQLYRQALELPAAENPSQGVESTVLWLRIGQVLLRQERGSEAETWLRRSLQQALEKGHSGAPTAAEAGVALAACLAHGGEMQTAQKMLDEYLPKLEAAYDAASPRFVEGRDLAARFGLHGSPQSTRLNEASAKP